MVLRFEGKLWFCDFDGKFWFLRGNYDFGFYDKIIFLVLVGKYCFAVAVMLGKFNFFFVKNFILRF